MGRAVVPDNQVRVATSLCRLTERLRCVLRRRPGRPRTGRGAKVISVSLEEELLAGSDALAKHLGISQAQTPYRLRSMSAARMKPSARGFQWTPAARPYT